MAEIILPPEENEETPQPPVIEVDKPTENSKVITIEFEAKKTNKVSTKDTNQQLYTTDTDAWFEFKETSLEGANGTYSVVFRNRHDGSIFQRTGDVVNGVAYYKIPHQEIRHAGAWRGQVVYTLSNGDTTAREFDYDVKGHILDGKDVREIVVEDFETLMAQLRSMKDNAELELANLVNTAEQNETDRQAFFNDLVEDIDGLQSNYQELLDTGVLQTNINEKLEELEEEYAPKLNEVTAQLAQTEAKKADKTYVEDKVDELKQKDDSLNAQLTQTKHVKIGGGVKAEPEDLSERTLGLVTGQGTINIESIPQNNSVTPAKTDFVIESRNLYNKETSVDFKNLEGTDSLKRTLSDYIPVRGATTYVSSHLARVIVYDASFNSIGGIQSISPTNPLTTVSLARFVRVDTLIVDKDNFQFEEGDVPTAYQNYGLRVPNLLLNGKTLGSDMELTFKEKSINPKHTNFITASTNLLNLDDVSADTFIDNTGNEVAQPGSCLTGFIPMSESVISFYGVVRVALYDENKTFLSITGSGVADEVVTRGLSPQTRYIKVVIDNDYIDVAQLNVGENLLPYEPFRHLSLESKYLPRELQSIIGNVQPKRPSHLLHWNPPVEEIGLIYDLFLSKPDNVLHGTKSDHSGSGRRVWRYEELGNTDTYVEGINSADVGMEGTIMYMHITPKEVVYITRDHVAELGWVYRARDIFDEEPELVLEMTTGAPNWLTCSSYYDGVTNIILAGEYGSDYTKQPRKFYISTNGGRDFRVLKETTVVKSDWNSHWHAGYFDSFDNRIWLSEGDTENRNLHFTTDFGETWETVDGGKHHDERHQPTLIFGWGERVMFGRDANYKPMGMDSYERVVSEEQRNEPPKLIDKYTVHKDQSAAFAYPQLPIGYTSDGEAYVLFSSVDKDIQTVIATGDYGQNWTSVFSSQYSQSRIEHIIGPTNEGYLCSRLRTHPDPSVPVQRLIYSEKPEWS